MGCYRCLEATPRRYDAAKTHLVNSCPWPPQRQQPQSAKSPNFRVVLFPEDWHRQQPVAQHPHFATVALAQQEHVQSQVYNPEDGYFHAEEYYYDQHFQHQEPFMQGANLSELSATDYYVDPVENKITPPYDSALSFQSLLCDLNQQKIFISNIPIRKVQTLSCEINGKVAPLTIDSGCGGNCARLDTCHRLSIPIRPIDKDDKSVPTQADGKSPLEIVGSG